MDIRSNWGQWAIVAVIILLAASGYTTLSNIGSLDELNEKVANLMSELGTETAESRSTEAFTSVEETLAAKATKETEDLAAATLPPESIQVVFPVQEKPLVLSSIHPQVQIRLKAMGKDFTNVTVRLTIVKKVEGEDSRIALQPGLSNTSVDPQNITVKKGEEKNVTLGFDKNELPASGTYEGWLVITTDDAIPTSQKATVDIVRPAIDIHHRLSVSDGTIELRGVQEFPDFLCFLRDDISWEEYKLRLWEHNLEEVDFDLLSSELADPNTGQTGYLETESKSGKTGLKPVEIKLDPKGITLAGTYEGLLKIFPKDGNNSSTLRVKAHVRDRFVWPFLTIFIGALVAQWLLRRGAKSANTSVPYQRLLIRAAEKRLRNIEPCKSRSPSPACTQLKRELELAEHALEIGDVNKAATLIKAVEGKITELIAAQLNIGQKAVAIDALARKYIEHPNVKEELREVRDLLRIAQDFLKAGLPAQVNQTLAQIPAALKAAKERLEDHQLERTLGKVAYKRNTDFITAPPDPTFYTDDRIQFKVADVDDSHYWKIKWVRPMWPDKVIDEKEGTQFTYEVTANLEDNYPRRYRVEAGVKGQEPTATLDFTVEHPYRIEIDRLVPYTDEKVTFTLEPPPSGKVTINWFVDGKQESSPYTFKEDREYRVAAKIDEKCIAARDLTVHEEPFKKASRRFKRFSWFIPPAWALAAAIAGLVYISDQLPAFGSSLDYILALAWGLGVGTSVAPKENLGDAIKKAMGIKREPAAEEPEKPAQQPVAEEPTKILVPDLKGKILAEVQKLYTGILEFKKDRDEAKDDWVIQEHKPEAGKEVEPKSTVILTLAEPGSSQQSEQSDAEASDVAAATETTETSPHSEGTG